MEVAYVALSTTDRLGNRSVGTGRRFEQHEREAFPYARLAVGDEMIVA